MSKIIELSAEIKAKSNSESALEIHRPIKTFHKFGKQFKQFNGKYVISDNGKVMYSSEKIQPQSITKDGYRIVNLWARKEKRNFSFPVARLVGIAFTPETFFPTCEINHKNHIRHDNRIENLEFITKKENLAQRIFG